MSQTTIDDRYAWAIETDSRIMQILEHLLKLRLMRGAVLDINSRGRQASIARQRGEIMSLLEESPSLDRRVTAKLVEKCYRTAAGMVATEYDVEPPAECLFRPSDVFSSERQ